jgi:hypothetical protein
MSSDLFKDAFQACLVEFDHLLDEKGWDQAPSLWVVERDMAHADMILFELSACPVGEALNADYPPDGLVRLASLVSSRQVNPPRPPAFFGYAYACEAWMILADSPEKSRQAAEDGLARRIHLRDDKQEVRTIAAVDIAGVHYMYTRFRDSAAHEPVAIAGHPKRDNPMASGRIHDSLQTLVEHTF